MNFLEAQDAIIQLVKRPDKRTDIKGHINRAIGLFAAGGTFFADLVELTHTIDGTQYAQSFSVATTPFARFRKIKYIRPTGWKRYLNWRDPSTVFDTNGCESLNVWYRAGNNIVFKVSTLINTLEIGYYQYHTILVDDEDTDWMLDEMWPAVHDIAGSYAFGTIGNQDEKRSYFALGMDQYRVYQKDLGDGVSSG
jgi:hypothetical protein